MLSLNSIDWGELGAVSALFALFMTTTLGILWKAFVKIHDTLFNRDYGFVAKWITERIETERTVREYLDKENRRNDTQLQVCQEHVSLVKGISFSQNTLVQAALEECRAARIAAEVFPDKKEQLLESITRAENILRSDHQGPIK